MALPKITYGEVDYEFLSLKGRTSRFGECVEPLMRPGYSGVLFRRLGQQPDSEPARLVGVVDASPPAALVALEKARKALQGKVVTITDDTGAVDTDMCLLLVECVGERMRHENAVGGMQATSTRYLRRFEILAIPTVLP